MTAICGIWHRKGQMGARDNVERMSRALAIYGPDRNDIWASSDIAFARQLMQILPEDEYDRQPLHSACGQIVLVADARIDNRAEQSAALDLNNTSRICDAAIILAAYEKWGDDCTQYLDGEYSFALWDDRVKQLKLVCDPFGRRPFYWFQNEDIFAFASMPKGLHALPCVPYRENTDFFVDGMLYMKPDPHRSCFGDLNRVASGNIVTIDRDEVRQSSWWQPPDKYIRLKNDAEYEEIIRGHLDRAINQQIRGETLVATHLSGGLDSSAVTATVARLLADTGQVHAYTSVPQPGYNNPDFSGRFADEGHGAAATAELYENIVHHKVSTPDLTPLDDLDMSFYYNEYPLTNLCNNVWMQKINQAVAGQGTRVLLIGDSGNLGPTHDGWDALSELARSGRWIELARLVKAIARNGDVRKRNIAVQIIKPLLPKPLFRAFGFWLNRNTRAIVDHSLINPALRIGRLTAAGKQEQWEGLDSPMRDMIAAKVTALCLPGQAEYRKGVLARWKVDIRDPLADRKLLEFCFAIPPEKFIKNGVPRGLARVAFADRLPPAVLGEYRKGYQAADWAMSLIGGQNLLIDEVERIAATQSGAHILDINALKKLAKKPLDAESGYVKQVSLRTSLLRGISAGHFLRKVSGSN